MRLRKVPKFFVDESGTALAKKPKHVQIATTAVPREFISISYHTDTELACLAGRGYTMIFDIESYINYFLIGFKCLETQKYVIFEDTPNQNMDLEKLNWVLFNFRLVGFNSIGFDIILALLALRGYKAATLKYYTNKIIQPNVPEEMKRKINPEIDFGLKIPHQIDHIDIMAVCPLKGSLKKYIARLHGKRLQDLPFDPEKELTYDEAEFVKNYCLASDIVGTELLFNELSEQIKLRYSLNEKYKVDVRSKSDAQIAEVVIKAEVHRKTGQRIKREEIGAGTSFNYIPPDFLKFETPMMNRKLQEIRAIEFVITDAGKLSMPEALANYEIPIADTVYKLGKGGLHSKEKCASYKAENGMLLLDIDVESFYPRLIINSKLYPEAIGPVFLEIFEEIVNRRITAKANAKLAKAELKKILDKLNVKYKELELQIDEFTVSADGLKITINGTFGKMGSKWSVMYAPHLLIQVTVTGQLSLLMLIERMELAGIKVVSANTDGIVLYIHESQYDLLNAVKDQWCKEASLKMEETRYKALYSKDVNNYIAVKTDGKVKLKGAYSNPWADKDLAIFRFHKNPVTTICIEAVEKLLLDGTPLANTIEQCRDITKFVYTRDVKGGAHKNGVLLGKTVRGYYAEDEKGTINYILTGNNVPDSEGLCPLMDLPDELPDDIDYGRYIEKANGILFDVGFYKRPEVATMFG